MAGIPRDIEISSPYAAGDEVLLTAAVRSLQLAYPNRFRVYIRTKFPEIWENNPHIEGVNVPALICESIVCRMSLIHRSNEQPHHAVEAFGEFLSQHLKVTIPSPNFGGDIHLSDEEKLWTSQVEELLGRPCKYWLICAGGKYDVTTKWWLKARYQHVVDALQNDVIFVQVGLKVHNHPPLRNVLDLRGSTTIRELIRLVYHAEGVLAPITLLMHLAAAVPAKPGSPKHKPCVVIAGGREPPHWESYPHHQYLHTVGALLIPQLNSRHTLILT